MTTCMNTNAHGSGHRPPESYTNGWLSLFSVPLWASLKLRQQAVYSTASPGTSQQHPCQCGKAKNVPSQSGLSTRLHVYAPIFDHTDSCILTTYYNTAIFIGLMRSLRKFNLGLVLRMPALASKYSLFTGEASTVYSWILQGVWKLLLL